MNLKALIPGTLLLVLTPGMVPAQNEPLKLIADSSGEMELPYGEQRTIEFSCRGDPAKTPTVLDFLARIDTPRNTKLTGGPVPLLTMELNGEMLDGSRLVNKPVKSPRQCPSDCVWYERPKWCLMYCGSWDPPPNEYTPEVGSPTRFVLDVSDLLKANEKNKMALIYCDTTVTIGADKTAIEKITLAEHCRRAGQGNATLMFGEMVIRPKKETDVVPTENRVSP